MSDSPSIELGLAVGALFVVLVRAAYPFIKQYAAPCCPSYCAAVAASDAGPQVDQYRPVLDGSEANRFVPGYARLSAPAGEGDSDTEGSFV